MQNEDPQTKTTQTTQTMSNIITLYLTTPIANYSTYLKNLVQTCGPFIPAMLIRSNMDNFPLYPHTYLVKDRQYQTKPNTTPLSPEPCHHLHYSPTGPLYANQHPHLKNPITSTTHRMANIVLH